jgi:hypothetical protein
MSPAAQALARFRAFQWLRVLPFFLRLFLSFRLLAPTLLRLCALPHFSEAASR